MEINIEFNICLEKVQEHLNVIRFILISGNRTDFIDTFKRLSQDLYNNEIILNKFDNDILE